MASIYSVSQANQYIKNMFTQDFLLASISVRGEISNCKYHSSGHIYFSIKDAGGVLSCVMFSSKRRGLNFQMSEGQKVIVSGNINVYERDGKYQLYANKIEKEGTGDLYNRFLLLKKELEEMGMFAEEYKQPIPKYAAKIGIVTSKTGAAIQDILNVSSRRNPYVQLVLYPALVQGEGASISIAKGIEYLDTLGLDVIIIGRGGGSIEELWAFNEEIVAKAIFNCNTPTVSAVGHEVDFTIADFVADMRAPTPSAAAELTVFDYNEFTERINNIKNVLNYKIDKKLKAYRLKINNFRWKIDKMSPINQIQSKRSELADISVKLEDLLKNKALDRRHQLEILSAKLNGLSPLNRISGGYAYVKNNTGNAAKSINDINENEEISLYFKDGKAKATINSKEIINI